MRYAAVPILTLALLTPAAFAQSEPAKPASPKIELPPAKPKTEAPKPEDPSDGIKPAQYPPNPKNKINAKRDLRDKQAPALRAERWLTGAPNRKDKTILVDFWATWCPPCRALTPELQKWQKTFGDDLVIIGISNESPSTVLEYMKEHNITYPMGVDSKGAMSKSVGVDGIPHVLVISSDNVVRWQGFPFSREDPLTEAKLKQIIDADKAARAAKQSKPKKDAPAEKPTDSNPVPVKPEKPAGTPANPKR